MMTDYAKSMGANSEVINWCETVLSAKEKKSGVDRTEAEHIIDFLVSDAAPNRLRKMSYKQAKIAADKWSKAQQKKGKNLIDTDQDIKTFYEFDDGTRIVKLLTNNAYQREGTLMAHCLGGYDPKNQTIYSYRDKENNPHATFQVSREGDEINQIKGKGNGPIHPKYIHKILAFLKALNIDVRRDDMINLGYQYVPEDYQKILNMYVDTKGKGPEYQTLNGDKYLVIH